MTCYGQDTKIKAEIITIGTELLLGDIVNVNASIIAKKLSQFGIDLYYITVVGDNLERLSEVFARAKRRSDLIITTGGLGPTADDITRQGIALAYDKELIVDDFGQKMIADYLRRRGKTVPTGVFSQALCPENGELIFNLVGSAPGIYIKDDDAALIALPGVTDEMKVMLNGPVASILQTLNKDAIIYSKFVKIYGKGEPEVEDLLRDLIESQSNPTIAPLANGGEVMIRLTCKAGSAEKAAALINPLVMEIERRLGENIYGYDDEDMEKAVASLLFKNNLTVALAESCTGGLIANRLTNIPDSSKYFMGSVVAYSNKFKEIGLNIEPEKIEKFGAVSPEIAQEMVNGLKKHYTADIYLAVTGIAGPGGGSELRPVGTVCYALAMGQMIRSEVQHFFHKDRLANKLVAATHGLDIIRRSIINHKGC